ncbi:MAG: DUF2400 family protein, partial [Proteobacteria bacterium]|nr:DUF2400 family protein [Pseudomonadota bacterium]
RHRVGREGFGLFEHHAHVAGEPLALNLEMGVRIHGPMLIGALCLQQMGQNGVVDRPLPRTGLPRPMATIYRGVPERRLASSNGARCGRPAAGSACKRLNLFLRWMVRRDAVDLGVWSGLSPSTLVIPLDTHVIRVGRCLGLTRYRSPGWAMATEITASLRRLDPEDPVRFDFSICHLGMMDACGFNRPQRDDRCPLRGVCRPAGRRRRVSPGPFVRR